MTQTTSINCPSCTADLFRNQLGQRRVINVETPLYGRMVETRGRSPRFGPISLFHYSLIAKRVRKQRVPPERGVTSATGGRQQRCVETKRAKTILKQTKSNEIQMIPRRAVCRHLRAHSLRVRRRGPPKSAGGRRFVLGAGNITSRPSRRSKGLNSRGTKECITGQSLKRLTNVSVLP